MNKRLVIDDDSVKNFTDEAKNKVVDLATDYANKIVKEATLIEESLHAQGASSITIDESTVITASTISHFKPKKSMKIIKGIANVVATILAGTIGFFDKSKFTDVKYLLFFIVVITFICIATFISLILEA